MLRPALIALLIIAPLSAQRNPGNPLTQLPSNIEVLTHFGERADISPDNQRIAFMNKSFGDAFVIDLKTKIIQCLTCSVPGTAFLRIMHLPSGDYMLIGPEHFTDIRTSRRRDNELWFLSKKPGSKPVKLGQRMSEGMAISKKAMKIAYSVLPAQDPNLTPEQSQLFVADVDTSGATPRIVNKKMVYESKSADCRLEAQDFFDNDRKMTFTCYEPKGLASVMTLDMASGKAENQSKAPGTYNECEGIFPDGQYTLVEADRQVDKLGGARGSHNIDIWKLRLDGTGKNFERLTKFNDYEGYKASNPVVSTDGRFMAFQLARTADEAGVGYGILMYRFR
jgi:Tol biopolymer transport system component